MTLATSLRDRFLHTLSSLVPWGLVALLGWLAALVCSDIAWRIWPDPAAGPVAQARHNSEALLPDVPAALWPQSTEPPAAPDSALPLSLVGGIRSEDGSQVVVIATPQGPRVASVGDEIMPGIYIRSITDQGVWLEQGASKERLSWPARPDRQHSAIRLVTDGQPHTGTTASPCAEGLTPVTNISEVCR